MQKARAKDVDMFLKIAKTKDEKLFLALKRKFIHVD
jgi:hypothetical protein